MTRINDIPLTIKFFLYEYYKKSETEYPLYVRLIINRTKRDISLKRHVNPQDWDAENGRYKDTSKHNRYQNSRLSEIEGKLFASYETLSREFDSVSAKMVKDLFKGKMPAYKTKLLDYFDSFIREVESKPGEYRSGTVKNYVATRNHLKNYLDRSKITHLLMKDFTKKYVMEFETYLLSLRLEAFNRNMKRNTANKYLTKLKTVVFNARQKGVIQHNPYEDFKIRNSKTNKVFLTKEEIQLLKTHPLGDNVSLQKVRDVFLFSTFTGLRYSDAINLTADKFIQDQNGTFWLSSYQRKTDEPIEIPVLDVALEIADRYMYLRESTGYVLPRISNQKVNAFLKDIARLTGINKNLTHHVARHTCATTVLLEEGVDIKTVSRWLSHSSLKSTECYAKITRNHLTNVLSKLNKTLSRNKIRTR